MTARIERVARGVWLLTWGAFRCYGTTRAELGHILMRLRFERWEPRSKRRRA